MKQILYKFYLKAYIALLRRVEKVVLFYRSFLKSIHIVLSFVPAAINCFRNMGRSGKTAFLAILILVSVSGVGLLGIVHSQTIAPSPSLVPNASYAASTSSLPPNAVQDEFEQFSQLVQNMVQGTTSSTSTTPSGGMLDVMAGVEAQVYTANPISLEAYGQYYGETHGLIKTADAQVTGEGYSALAPIIPLWELFRNVAYIVIVLMVVIIGFIIIFGGQYGQNEVTIISTIPKIFFALILITFSYPIAGLMIDISNLGINLIVNTLGPEFVSPGDYFAGRYPSSCSNANQPYASLIPTDTPDTSVYQCVYQPNVPNTSVSDFNVFRLMAPLVNYGDWNAGGRGAQTVANLIRTPTNIGFLDDLLQAGGFINGVTEFGINFILELLILFWAIKVFVAVLGAFVRMVIAAMFGPLMLIGIPLSGTKAAIGWLKGLLVPAITFPAIFAMLFIAAILAYGTDCPNNKPCDTQVNDPTVKNSTENIGPWYINNNNGLTNFDDGPLLFVDTVNPNFIWNFVAIGIIIAIPGVGKHLDETFGTQASRALQEQGNQAGQSARRFAGQIPVIGGFLRNFGL